jgi:DNA repair exonuclease SbcCD ATPase subunit
MRLSAEQRHQNESRIRAAMDRLLRGQIPPGGKCDVKTLASEAGMDRTAFYGNRPYARLREEFEARLVTIRETGGLPDPREAQISKLKNEIAALKERLARRDQTISKLTDFRTEALARLAAQHDEITHLRQHHDRTAKVRRLPARASGTRPCS